MIDLLHGDCLNEMQSIPDKSIDMILTDPPYGTTACSWDSVIPFDAMWKQLKRIIKDNGAIALFGSQPFTSALIMSNVKMFKYEWIWDKGLAVNFLNAPNVPLKTTERIMIFGGDKYYPQMRKGKYRKKGNTGNQFRNTDIYKENGHGKVTYNDHYYPTDILNYTNANHNDKQHPTQKPVKLLEYLIKTYTQKEETVLDFTMGSGSTGVACVNTKRNFIGIELDENYFNIAGERIAKAQQSPTFDFYE
jgi:site-specific DNA-methyltransferase (adenine-specific)